MGKLLSQNNMKRKNESRMKAIENKEVQVLKNLLNIVIVTVEEALYD